MLKDRPIGVPTRDGGDSVRQIHDQHGRTAAVEANYTPNANWQIVRFAIEISIVYQLKVAWAKPCAEEWGITMDDRTISAGDIVRLRSGGPNMTVSMVGETMGGTSVWCEWFDRNGMLQKATFAPASLETVKDPIEE